MTKLYECRNKACTLGARGAPGQFTGGITAAQAALLTGEPVELVVKHGEGFCPNCGEEGVEIGEHESVVGDDPLAPLHAQAAGAGHERAQEELLRLVAEQKPEAVAPSPAATAAPETAS